MFVQSGAAALTVGAASGSPAAINIGTTANGGTLTTGTGVFSINPTGTVTVGGGLNTGTLNASGDVLIDGGQLVVNPSSAVLTAPGKTITLQNGGTFSGFPKVDGGVFHLVNASGTLDLQSLNVTNGGRATFDLDGGNYTSPFGGHGFIVSGANSVWEFVDGSSLTINALDYLEIGNGALLSVAGDVIFGENSFVGREHGDPRWYSDRQVTQNLLK